MRRWAWARRRGQWGDRYGQVLEGNKDMGIGRVERARKRDGHGQEWEGNEEIGMDKERSNEEMGMGKDERAMGKLACAGRRRQGGE